MANFVKNNIGGNIIVINNDISRLIEIIGIDDENVAEMATNNLVYLATTLYMCKIRSTKERYGELVKNIVIFALTKSKYNNMFNIVEEDLVCYDLSTNKRTEIVEKDLIDIFINNAEMRKQMLGLIKEEYEQYKSSISTNKK